MEENPVDTVGQPELSNEYIKVVPSMGSLETDSVLGFVKSLRKADSSSILDRVKPFRRPPTFEFLVYRGGQDTPVEFLFGCSDERLLELLERKLRTAYPDSFEFTRTSFSVETALRPRFDRLPSETPGEDEGATNRRPSRASSAETQTLIEQFSRESNERSAVELEPIVVRWDGVGERPKDFMTTLKRYSKRSSDRNHPSRSSLSYILEVITSADFPIVFQVLFQRRPSWTGAARRRKNNIRLGQDGSLEIALQWIHDLLFGISTEEKRDRYRGQTPTELGESAGLSVEPTDDIAGRVQLIDKKIPAKTFTVNVRAATVAIQGETSTSVRSTMEDLMTAFDDLDGYFYSADGAIVSSVVRDRVNRRSNGRVLTAGQLEYDRLINRRIVSSNARKRRPHLVLNHDELANFVTVPSAKTLTVAGARGTEGKLPSQNPLPRPPARDLEPYRAPGMEIGHALDENHRAEHEGLHIPARLQPKHCLVAVPTGGGKSIFNINAGESIARNNGGPVVVIDPKGDGMCLDYMRVHFAEFGDLDNVYYFPVPEILPAIPFYDIRPRIANHGGRDPRNVREEAVQDKVNHTHEILRMVMGREVYDRAFANTITSYLIHALFDEEYGSDAFGLDDLFDAALEMQRERTIPPVSPGRPNDPERSLSRHFSKDKRQFQQSMDAVLNRLEEIKEDSFLSQIFSHVPEWDEAKEEYRENVFDFRRFLNEDVVILFDMGDLRPEAQRVLTMVFLSHVWDAVQDRKREDHSDYEKVTNLIIDEAAPIASTSIVSEQLLPQSRSFGLGVTLLVQYARQIRNVAGNDKAYEEVLNNVHSKIIGDISIDQTLLNSLVHDELSPADIRNRINRLPSGEWVVQLPSPGFGEPKPPLFSLQPLPIPPGHPESDTPLSPTEERRFKSELLASVIERTARVCGIQSVQSPASKPMWGSREAVVDGGTDEASGLFSSMFMDAGRDEGDEQPDGSTWGDPDATQSSQRPTETTEAEGTVFGSSGVPGDEQVPNGTEDDSEPFTDNLDTSLSGDPSAKQGASDSSGRPELESKAIPKAGAAVTDEEREAHGLTDDDVRFLKRVLDAMNDDLPGYTLLDSMTTLTEGLEKLDVSRLVEAGFIEADSVSRRRYYTVLPAGRRVLGETVSSGPGRGDLGEKTPHKVGVEMLARWFEQRDSVARVEKYHEHDPETVFDVVAFDDTDDIAWVGEVELASKDTQDPIRDFDKMGQVDANAIWVFKNREDAETIIDALADADRLRPVTGRDRKTIARLRKCIEAQSLKGMTTVRTFREVESELER